MLLEMSENHLLNGSKENAVRFFAFNLRLGGICIALLTSITAFSQMQPEPTLQLTSPLQQNPLHRSSRISQHPAVPRFVNELKSPSSVPTDTGYTWMRQYHSNCDCPAQDLANAYDKGILLLGWFGGSWPTRCWLTKTDVNGEVLWEKTLGDGQNINVMIHFVQNSEGDIFLTSLCNQFDLSGDPMVVKLNACGEKQWCRVFSTPGRLDVAYNIFPLQDGGCMATLWYASYDPNFQQAGSAW